MDLVVSDLTDFGEDETSQLQFTTRQPELFLEAKYFPAGCPRSWRYDHICKVPSVLADAERLAQHLKRGHCPVAAGLRRR